MNRPDIYNENESVILLYCIDTNDKNILKNTAKNIINMFNYDHKSIVSYKTNIQTREGGKYTPYRVRNHLYKKCKKCKKQLNNDYERYNDKCELCINEDNKSFNYYNKTDVDLSRYQIYTKEQINIKESEENCLIHCFKTLGFNIENLKTLIKTNIFPQKHLKKVCEILNIKINLSN